MSTRISLILVAVLLTAGAFAQSPEKMSYQAVIRNSNDALVTNTQIGMQISILQISASGTAVYTEIQTPTTNANGLVSIEIGTGTTSDDFAAIDWTNGPYFIKTETDPTGGTNYTITGTSQLLSVPYALHSKTAESVTGTITETDPVYANSQAVNITATDITNLSNLSGTNTGDQDLSGLAAQSALADTAAAIRLAIPDVSGFLSTEADPVFGSSPANIISSADLTNWNNSFSWGNHANAGYLTSEVDGSVTNELQVLSISNDTIYLSNGGYVKLPAGFDGQYSSLTGAPTNIGTFTNDAGYLTSYTETDPEVGNNTTNVVSKWDGTSLVSSSIYDNGKVGIGTTNPEADLEVNGDLKVSGNFYAPGSVVQTVIKTSEDTSYLDVTTFTEANPNYRISIVPKYSNSIFLIEYSFSINTYMAAHNTIFHMQLVRDIGGSETLVGVGPSHGNRDRTSYVSRPNNGTDTNDMQNVYMVAKDTGLSVGTTYTYGFKYRRETGGSGTCYFNYSNGDSDIYGFSGIMIMKITEIAQ